MIKLIAGEFSVDKAAADGEGKRTISGVAVPYNVFATVSDGSEIMFMPGSLPVDGKAPRLFMYHDASQPIGVVTEAIRGALQRTTSGFHGVRRPLLFHCLDHIGGLKFGHTGFQRVAQ